LKSALKSKRDKSHTHTHSQGGQDKLKHAEKKPKQKKNRSDNVDLMQEIATLSLLYKPRQSITADIEHERGSVNKSYM